MPGRRKGATAKRVYLTDEGLAVVQKYADENFTAVGVRQRRLDLLGLGVTL